MIKITSAKKIEILQFLEQNFIENLFFIGDINEFGFDDHKIQTFAFYEDNVIKAALMVFHSTLLISDKNKFIKVSVLEEIVAKYSIQNIITDDEYALYLSQILSTNYSIEIKKEEILTLNKKIMNSDFQSHLAKKTDLSAIIHGRKQIDEFAQVSQQTLDINYLTKTFDSGFYVPFIIKDAKTGIIKSHASVSCMTPKAAMIGGVYTLKEFRNFGYATDCLLHLCKYLQEQNKLPILFFDNPLAGKVYKKIGFEHYGWLNVMILNRLEK